MKAHDPWRAMQEPAGQSPQSSGSPGCQRRMIVVHPPSGVVNVSVSNGRGWAGPSNPACLFRKAILSVIASSMMRNGLDIGGLTPFPVLETHSLMSASFLPCSVGGEAIMPSSSNPGQSVPPVAPAFYRRPSEFARKPPSNAGSGSMRESLSIGC
jgi:hypothetical protein